MTMNLEETENLQELQYVNNFQTKTIQIKRS